METELRASPSVQLIAKTAARIGLFGRKHATREAASPPRAAPAGRPCRAARASQPERRGGRPGRGGRGRRGRAGVGAGSRVRGGWRRALRSARSRGRTCCVGTQGTTSTPRNDDWSTSASLRHQGPSRAARTLWEALVRAPKRDAGIRIARIGNLGAATLLCPAAVLPDGPPRPPHPGRRGCAMACGWECAPRPAYYHQAE